MVVLKVEPPYPCCTFPSPKWQQTTGQQTHMHIFIDVCVYINAQNQTECEGCSPHASQTAILLTPLCSFAQASLQAEQLHLK